MLVNKSSKKLHEDIKINSNNSTIEGIKLFENYTKKKLYLFLHLMLNISWKSDNEWLQENVLKINGFIWNI
jgi:hypothetical protein